MNFTIKSVITEEDRNLFYDLPQSIYQHDSNWIPHLKQDVEYVFNEKKNKYYSHGTCMRWILKDEKKQVIGRIAAFINEKKAYSFDQPTGGIGFFESIDNIASSKILFDTAKEWLQSKGMEAMDGPINFGENNKFWGLIIENFSFPTYQGQNYNHPYYVNLFETYGFKVYYNQIINYRKVEEPISDKFVKKAEIILSDNSYHIETIKKSNLGKYAEDFRTVYNEAWGTHENFKKMNYDLAQSLFKKMKPIIDEDLICFVYYKNAPVGFCLGIPDINPIIKKIQGNLNLIGKVKFLLYKKWVKIKRINGIAIGVHPEHQGNGIESAIFIDLAKRIQPKNKYEDVVVTWVGDFNPKMQYIFESIGFYPIAKMATYRLLFDPNQKFARSPIIK
jgi:GNAT superfamily N-acetyltransferase